MTKEEVLNVIPEPEYSINRQILADDIWRYGNFDLMFEKDQLSLIFNDHIDSIDGGNVFKVDKWIIGNKEENRLINFITHLIKENIDFRKTTDIIGHIILKGIDTGIAMTFGYPDAFDNSKRVPDPNEYELTAICKN